MKVCTYILQNIIRKREESAVSLLKTEIVLNHNKIGAIINNILPFIHRGNKEAAL